MLRLSLVIAADDDLRRTINGPRSPVRLLGLRDRICTSCAGIFSLKNDENPSQIKNKVSPHCSYSLQLWS